jgi:hypothetical protein
MYDWTVDFSSNQTAQLKTKLSGWIKNKPCPSPIVVHSWLWSALHHTNFALHGRKKLLSLKRQTTCIIKKADTKPKILQIWDKGY